MNSSSNSCGDVKNQSGASAKEFCKKVRDLQGQISDGSIGLADSSTRMDELESAYSALLKCKEPSLFDVSELLLLTDEDEKKDSLFEGNWFHRGKAVALASMSGAGKSVLTMQLCCAWACGRAAFGLKPVRPLKIMLIQGEDNKFATKDLYRSVAKGVGEYGETWSTTEKSKIEKNLRLYIEPGKKDEKFFDFLMLEQAKNKYDLIVVNPLARVTSCTLSDGKEANNLADNFDRIINSSLLGRCGLLIVHHTTKAPQNRNQATGFGHGINAQYAMAGAQEFMGWFRAIFMIVPDQRRWDKSKLLLAKGDAQRVGWPIHCSQKGDWGSEICKDILKEPPESDFKFWREDGKSNSAVAVKENGKGMSIEDQAKAVVKKMELRTRYTAGKLDKLAEKTLAIPKTRAKKVAKEIRENHDDYAVFHKTGSGNTNFYWVEK